jgi:DUF1365 family protein
VSTASALYVGRVTHHRLRPRRHSLAYRAYWLLLDLDEVAALGRRLRLFSHNRLNLFSFYDADHDRGESGPLRAAVEGHLASDGIAFDGGPIRLLAMPRLLGYVFNPLSIYFCHRKDGSLAALLYEVRNTFGEHHTYLIAAPEAENGAVHQHCAKRFYVSPFLGMDMRYDFSVVEPDSTVRVVIRGSDPSGDVIVASLLGRRVALTDVALLKLLFTHPLMTLKVTLGIHWEALLLWLKGVRLQPKPTAPEETATAMPASTIPRSST